MRDIVERLSSGKGEPQMGGENPAKANTCFLEQVLGRTKMYHFC
jgi:hypothetical protein